MCAKETHLYCNAFSLVMMCQVTGEGDLLDFYGEKLTSINDLVQDITNVSTLNKKPKLLMVEGYPGNGPSCILKLALVIFCDYYKFPI